ncbi:MAG: hypothetical protein QOJ00_826 [Actinomycetota bacterium]|jgi:hypothetical protein
MTTATIEPRTQDKPLTEQQFLRSGLVSAVVLQVVLFLIFAGLATSRAAGHVLSATAVFGIVTVAAAGSTIVGWISNLYSASYAGLMGTVTLDPDAPVAGNDPFAFGTLWRTTLAWALGAAAWAAAGAGLIAVALNGRVARFPVIFVSLVAMAGVNVIAIGNAARRRGVAAATTAPSRVVSVRRRAWRELAVPLALSQGLLNGSVAWLLFHSYPTGDAAIPGVLTDSTALADALLVVVPLTVLFAGITRYWGAFEIATGRVSLDDPDTQTVARRSPIGVQFMVYACILGLVAFKIAGLLLPATPSLAAVMITRGVLAAVLVFVSVGVGFVRGACNGLPE